jgi:predicted adenylyl cyclase CyaB
VIGFNKEVEMKLRVDESIKNMLRNLSFVAAEEVDEYFETKQMLDERHFLRLRTKKGKIKLEFKALTAGGKTRIYESDETECDITQEQYGPVKKMLNSIFPIVFEVRKVRGRCALDGCELCHDKVEGLGEFLEIEGPKEKILGICQKYSIDVERLMDREEGYAMMTVRKNGLI